MYATLCPQVVRHAQGQLQTQQSQQQITNTSQAIQVLHLFLNFLLAISLCRADHFLCHPVLSVLFHICFVSWYFFMSIFTLSLHFFFGRPLIRLLETQRVCIDVIAALPQSMGKSLFCFQGNFCRFYACVSFLMQGIS